MQIITRIIHVVLLAVLVAGLSAALAQREPITIEGTDPRLKVVYWTADGENVVTVSDERVEAWNVASGEKFAETTLPLLVDYPLTYAYESQRIAWTADGAYAAVVAEDGRSIGVYEHGNPEPINTIAGEETQYINGVLWHPTEPILVPEYDGFPEAVTFHDALDGSVVAQIPLEGERTVAGNPTFSADGELFAFARFSMGASDIVIYPFDDPGDEMVALEAVAYTVPVRLRWLGDRRLYANVTDDGSPAIYDVEAATWDDLPARALDWSPNGCFAVVLGDDQQALDILDGATGETARTLPLPEYELEVVRFTWGAGGIAVYRSLPLTLWQIDEAELAPEAC